MGDICELRRQNPVIMPGRRSKAKTSSLSSLETCIFHLPRNSTRKQVLVGTLSKFWLLDEVVALPGTTTPACCLGGTS